MARKKQPVVQDSEADESGTEQHDTPASTNRSTKPVSPDMPNRRKPTGKAPRNADEDDDDTSSITVEVASPWDVDSVLRTFTGPKRLPFCSIKYVNGKGKEISIEQLKSLPNGQNALKLFQNRDADSSDHPGNMSSSAGKRTHRIRTQVPKHDFVDVTKAQLSDSDDPDIDPKRRNRNGTAKSTAKATRLSESDDPSITKKRRTRDGKAFATSNATHQSSRVKSRPIADDDNDEEDDDGGEEDDEEADEDDESDKGEEDEPAIQTRRSTRSTKPARDLRGKGTKSLKNLEEEEADELAGGSPMSDEVSDIQYTVKRTKERAIAKSTKSKSRKSRDRENSHEAHLEQPTRFSARETKGKSYREQDMDEEIFADAPEHKNLPKIISIREIYPPLPKSNRFRCLHDASCDICKQSGKQSNQGPSELVYCQGCSTSIHKVCLGYRSGREHMVTKIGHENFVLQCRRCIGLAAKKDQHAPRLDKCSGCHESGASCAAFSPKKTAKQEEKLREENNGDDPVTEVDKELVNNADNLLFRCRDCQRGFHFHHLPPLDEDSSMPEDEDEIIEERFMEYRKKWQCKECYHMEEKIDALVAWRPIDANTYSEGQDIEDFGEDDREYLVKWANKSYFHCIWAPGAWVWGVTKVAMRKAFVRRDEGINLLPKWTKEDAIPDEFLSIEIVFKVRYTEGFKPENEKHARDSINMVEEVYVKFRGLGYQESVWEAPPEPKQKEFWKEYVSAYNEYVAGLYFENIPATAMRARIARHAKTEFVELTKQPSTLTGGEMMPYQLEGLNWLLYKFHQKKNAILADEMGLGKTIQVISMITALVKDDPKCWPFLVVTPNSTCPNWRREIKKWAPDLRVVAYYGGKDARDMAKKYEMFPGGCSDLRAHIVVTSYEAPVDDHSRSFFKNTKWAGLIVDEGQRLKNDENLLYGALQALKVPFQLLLTGTPLQNNTRELFNLLQFLDADKNAAQLDEEFSELTKENLPKLHELIRPFFLRRTKVQVLKFLPAISQVILPVTMSIVQKKLYKSILAKNPDLIKAIFGASKAFLPQKERGNLNNILMQLRKCLCHPFIYSSAIEERGLSGDAMHRNLIDASSKFQLLEIMLPKLKERGHRVLLFSQFLSQLDLIEDFLNGLDLPYQRLDGNVSTLEKQKRIDAFNAPDSPYFAFLLSTRAGGVGINLATADTVIIMDPDFNPHQDMQALSRAHRIGQKNKVLVFKLMTKDSAEEKITQIGRKKMALDQALIEHMDTADDAGVDLESILKHGAEALFNDDDTNDIHYDSASVDKLLDRTHVENANPNEEKPGESQFSYARVWAQDKGDLSGELGDPDAVASAPNIGVWEKILEQRAAEQAAEQAKMVKLMGRGNRVRNAVQYGEGQMDDTLSRKRRKPGVQPVDDNSDIEFGPADSENDDDESDAGSAKGSGDDLSFDNGQGGKVFQDRLVQKVPKSNLTPKIRTNEGQHDSQASHQAANPPGAALLMSRPSMHGNPTIFPGQQQPQPLMQAHQPVVSSQTQNPPHQRPVKYAQNGWNAPQQNQQHFCQVCLAQHPQGFCKLKLDGIDFCGLCGLAHFSSPLACPQLQSEVEIRVMLDELRKSPDRASVEQASKVLRQELVNRALRRRSQNQGAQGI